jgi:hypothetical protein
LKVKYILAGLAISFLLIRVFHLSTSPVSVQLFSLFLAYTACVYFGAALSDSRIKIITLELGMSILFFASAVMGMFYSPIWLVIGYAAHGIWDWMHHPKVIKTKVIHWFPPICLVVDFVVAGYIYFFLY